MNLCLILEEEGCLWCIIVISRALFLDSLCSSDCCDLSVDHLGCDKVGVGDISCVDASGCNTRKLLGTDQVVVYGDVFSLSW